MSVSNPKIIIGPTTFGVSDPEPLEKLKLAGFDTVPNPVGRKLTEAELCDLLPGAIGVIAGLEPFTRRVLELSELKVISRCGAGLSNVDVETAARLGIRVLSTPEAPTVSVAELTVGAIITLLRHLHRMDRNLHNGIWQKHIGVQLQGKTVLIIGFGRIGRKVAELLRPFGVRLLATDPGLRGRVDEVDIVALHEGLRLADVVTIHASGEAQLIGHKELSELKKGAFLLNAGRGGLVNEQDLCSALDAGSVSGAWLDVFSDEPYTGPLTKYDQVLLSPHIASATAECRRRMEMEAVQNLLSALGEYARQS